MESPEKALEMLKLWEELKVISISRLIGAMLGMTLLNTLLQLQHIVIAREAYDRSQSDDSKEKDSLQISKETREEILLTFTSNFLSNSAGFSRLVENIKASVKKSTSSWKMGTDQKVDLDGIKETLKSIKTEITDTLFPNIDPASGDKSLLISCLVPLSVSVPGSSDIQQELTNEVMDLLESPFTEEIYLKSFEAMFDVLLEKVQKKKYQFLSPSQGVIDATANKALVTKVVVGLLKEVSVEVLQYGNEFVEKLFKVSELDSFTNQLFAVTDGVDGLEDFGDLGMDLSTLGLNQSDIKSFQGLLSGDEGEMMKMLQMLGEDETAGNLLES